MPETLSQAMRYCVVEWLLCVLLGDVTSVSGRAQPQPKT